MEHAYTPNLVLTPYMGLTEKEMNIMAPLVYQVEKCRLSCEQLEKMLTSLETQKNEQLAQVNKWFEHAHLVLNQSHAFSTGEIKVKCTEVHALLAQHLETTRQTQLNIADCHVFTWDPSCRGSSVRLTNENKTASCSVDQTVFGTTLLPSSPVEWEVDLWNLRGIAPTNCYIGVGKKNEVNISAVAD
jgi:hypothetical protein